MTTPCPALFTVSSGFYRHPRLRCSTPALLWSTLYSFGDPQKQAQRQAQMQARWPWIRWAFPRWGWTAWPSPPCARAWPAPLPKPYSRAKGGAAAAGTAPGAAPPPPPPSLWLANTFLSFWGALFGAVAVLLQVGVAAGGAGGAARGCVGGGLFGASFACMLRPSTGLVAPHSPHRRRPLTLLPPPSGPLFAPSLIARTVHWRGEPMEPFRRLLFFAGTPTLPSFHSHLGRPDAGPMAVDLLPPATCTSTHA